MRQNGERKREGKGRRERGGKHKNKRKTVNRKKTEEAVGMEGGRGDSAESVSEWALNRNKCEYIWKERKLNKRGNCVEEESVLLPESVLLSAPQYAAILGHYSASCLRM